MAISPKLSGCWRWLLRRAAVSERADTPLSPIKKEWISEEPA
jgi:hypothetical protein